MRQERCSGMQKAIWMISDDIEGGGFTRRGMYFVRANRKKILRLFQLRLSRECEVR